MPHACTLEVEIASPPEARRRVAEAVAKAMARGVIKPVVSTPEPDVRTVLIRLKRWLGMERRRFYRIHKEATNPPSKERAFGEANVCSMAMHRIDVELRKLEPIPKPKRKANPRA